MPKYGGHCAFAASTGFSAPGNGQFWSQKNDKLYFFSNKEVLEEFQKDPDNIISLADKNWK